MKRELKYIIKRIIIGVGIALVLGCIKANALSVDELTPVACYNFFYRQNDGVGGLNVSIAGQNIDYSRNFYESINNSNVDYFVFPYSQSSYQNTTNDINVGNVTIFPARMCFSSVQSSFSSDYCSDCVYNGGYYICPNAKNMFTSNFRLYANTYLTQTTISIPQYICGYRYIGNANTNAIINNNNDNTQQIIDSNEDILDQQQQTYDFLTDNNINTGGGAGRYFGDNEFQKTYGLSDFILIPINFIQSITSKTCSAINIPIPFTNNQTITLPCMYSILDDRFHNFIVVYQTIISGIIVFRCIIGTYHDVQKAVDPDQRMMITDMFT